MILWLQMFMCEILLRFTSIHLQTSQEEVCHVHLSYFVVAWITLLEHHVNYCSFRRACSFVIELWREPGHNLPPLASSLYAKLIASWLLLHSQCVNMSASSIFLIELLARLSKSVFFQNATLLLQPSVRLCASLVPILFL